MSPPPLGPAIQERGRDPGEGGPRRYWVRVPASTSNLGPGFDSLGMAVDAFFEATWEAAAEGSLRVTRSGCLEGAAWAPEADLVVEVLRDVGRHESLSENDLRARGDEGGSPARGRLHLHSEIPLGRGLGSSAAARVAGAALARLIATGSADRGAVLQDAAVREGHPDNAAPAVLGGLVAAVLDETGRVVAVPLPLSLRIGWVFAAPGVGLATSRARGALPGEIPFAAAVRNTGRLALLLPALAAGDGAVLARAMEDEIHVPYRLPLIAGAREAVDAARAAGAWGVTLSGAGSGLVAAVPRGLEAEVGSAMARCFEDAPGSQGGEWRALRPWVAGAQWGPGPLRPRGPARFATSPA